MWPRFEDYSAQRSGLTGDTSASTTFAIGPAEAGLLIYASAPRLPRPARRQQPGRRSSVISLCSPLLPACGKQLSAMTSSNVEAVGCSANPVDLMIGRSRGHWKFLLDMHSIGVGYRRLKAPCARASARSTLSHRGVHRTRCRSA
jgi:hypothetical protein